MTQQLGMFDERITQVEREAVAEAGQLLSENSDLLIRGAATKNCKAKLAAMREALRQADGIMRRHGMARQADALHANIIKAAMESLLTEIKERDRSKRR